MIPPVALGMAFLTSTLGTDSTLASLAPGGVNADLAEIGVPTPYILIAWQGGGYTLTSNGIQVLAPLLYQVKAVGPASNFDAIVAAAARFDSLLGGDEPISGPVIVNGQTVGNVDACYPESPLSMGEDVNGALWMNLGGLYRLEIERMAT